MKSLIVILSVAALVFAVVACSLAQNDETRPNSYLDATVEPCTPIQGIDTDTCGRRVLSNSGRTLLPDVPRTMYENMLLYSEALPVSFVIRGTTIPGTTRCMPVNVAYVVNGERTVFVDNLGTAACAIDVRVNEYIVGKGPATLTVHLGTNAPHWPLSGKDALKPENLKENIANSLAKEWEGVEVVLWLQRPFNVLVQAWNYGYIAYVERIDGKIKVVDQYIDAYSGLPSFNSDLHLSKLEFTLEDYRRDVKEAHAKLAASLEASIASGDTRLLIADANDEFLRARLIKLGANDDPSTRLISFPSGP